MSTMVFVYGTLKQGYPNFHVNAGTRMDGDYQTEQAYPLLLVGERHTPWLINSPGQGQMVRGQLFEVTMEQLAQMDKLERTDEPDGYRRELIRVIPLNEDPPAPQTVFAYLKDPALLSDQDIQSEMLGDYSAEHAALYRTPE